MYRNLKLHMLHKHTDIPRKKFPCDFEGCESLFATKQGLVKHQKRHDPGYTTPEPTTFVCETCGKTFSTSGALKKHSYIHTGNMPFHCGVCDKKYPTSYKLKEHTMRHQGIKNHTCPQCGLKKTTMHELRAHMKYHTKDKQFPCEFCEHVFLNQGNLKRHIRIVHRKIKSYNCTHCSQSFGKAETLKNHIMTHTGEKPHACTVCGKRFIQLVALRKHANVHVKNASRKMNRIHFSLSPIKLEDNPEGELRSDDESLHGSTIKCKLENPSGISGVIKESFSNNQASENEGDNKMVENESDPFAQTYSRADVQMKNSHEYHKHTYIHNGNMPFRCAVCNKGYPTAYKLKQHTSRQNCKPNNQTESETMVKLGDNANDPHFSGNESSDDPKLTVECKLESPECKSDAFEEHVLNENVSGEEDYGSDVDYFNNSTETEDDSHPGKQNSAKEGIVESLECQLCGKRFRNPIRFEGHLRTHQGLKPGLCKLCGKEFTTYHNLKMHMLHKHTEIPRKKYPCDFDGCESLFATKQGLIMHRRRHDPGYTTPEPKTFVCETCGKIFSSSGSLKTHLYTHNGNMPFPCTICDKKYPTAHTLKEHTMRHKGIKMHTCPQCGLKKTTMHELRVHMNYHTKEKQFPCEFCEHVFLNKGNLQRHIRIVHQKMKSYNCTHCSQSFGKAETLKHHIMTHTGEKPHACTVCGKRFIQLVALRKHANVHAKNERRMTNQSPSTE
ncbi:zinc finger protein 845-like [Anopheles ziemanni]|uniref:zinc finger protein 845-like n=1 Tax=Anopheles ziemanni TaxID=345580 RepID=UPI00265FCA43|nr:zinc finger protein 845-like [Anopheles ziemanni]